MTFIEKLNFSNIPEEGKTLKVYKNKRLSLYIAVCDYYATRVGLTPTKEELMQAAEIMQIHGIDNKEEEPYYYFWIEP